MYKEQTRTLPEFKAISIKRYKFVFNFDIDYKFFAIIPAININLHSKEFEIEWLFYGLYIRKSK